MTDEESLAYLPGQNQDLSARKIREQLKRNTSDPEVLIDEKSYNVEIGGVDFSKLDAEMYALASFVIEQQWALMRERLPENGVPVSIAIEGANTYQAFIISMLDFIKSEKDNFKEVVNKRMEDPEYVLTKEDALLARYIEASLARSGSVGLPSMIDLVVLMGKAGEAIPAVFEREVGRAPTTEEVVFSVEHPSMQRLFSEIMTNSRELTYPLIGFLERSENGQPKLETDIFSSFNPDCFETATDEEGKLHVRLKSTLIQRYRELMQKKAEEMVESNSIPARALQCPVLYTGVYKEMYTWVSYELRLFLKREESKAPV